MRGYVSGIVWGVLLCGGGLAALSILSPLAPAPDLMVNAAEPEAPQGLRSDKTSVDGVRIDPAVIGITPESPVARSPEPGDLGGLPRVGSLFSDQPFIANPAPSPAQPAGATPMPDVTDEVGPAKPNKTPSAAPETPAQDKDVEAETSAPVRPRADDAAGAENSLPDPRASKDRVPAIWNDPDRIPTAASPGRVRSDAGAGQIPEMADLSAPEPRVLREPALPTPMVRGSALILASAERPAVPTAPDRVPVPRVDQRLAEIEQPKPAPPRIAPLPQIVGETETLRPTIGTPVVPLTERHRSDRWTGSGQTETDQENPLVRFAAAFDGAKGRPLISIVLIDDADANGLALLQGYDWPLSIALDPARPGARERMTGYRAAGYEVLSLVRLPRFATAADAEVTLSAGLDILNEAVGLIEGQDLQGNRDLSAQIVAFAGATGRGLVTQGAGLGTTLKFARRDGVPAAAILRALGDGREGMPAIRRSLDGAVIRAGQEGGVVMTAGLRPEILVALRTWSEQGNAERVSLAPVSAMLMKRR